MIIFDLDGTLTDCSHRQHLVHNLTRGVKPQWDEFFARCVDDKPVRPIIDIFRALVLEHKKILRIWSGRSSEVRQQTHDWLDRHVGVWNWNLMLRMRPEGNHTPDEQLKEQWLNIELGLGANIEMVFDDRDKVVAMWRRHGIICAQVAPGDF